LLPTADKTKKKLDITENFDRTPERSYKANIRGSAKLSNAKNTINEVIGSLSNKKNINDDAINEVKIVNSEILHHLNSFTAFQPSKLENQTRYHTAEQIRRE
jgi:hypothetical protein